MQFDRLLTGVEVLDRRGDLAVDVVDVTHDTAAVGPGAVYCCIPGRRVDGHELAPQAVEAGAVALLCERMIDVDVPQARVADVRRAMAPVAAAAHDHPARDLVVVGVTGTNGKTTVTHLLAAIFDANGWPTQVTGTMNTTRTTPEAPDLHRRLAHWRAEGGRAAALEVSSAALVAHRVDALPFAAAVFTNLGTDHLGEVHPTLEDYFEAKASFFRPEHAAVGVVNADDEHGRRIIQRGNIPIRPFSMADAIDLDVGLIRSTFRWDGRLVRLAMGGAFNVGNAVAAAVTARELGIDSGTVADGLSAVPGVKGHTEPIDAGQPFTVLVDYAHTPEAVSAVVHAARDAAADTARIIIVFGCGGDRDHHKRPLMGAAAATADVVVVTSDNPRGEDPLAIIAAVRAGIGRDDAGVITEADRAVAIALALDVARPGDIVVIAGKGHETGQTIGTETHPFDDRAVAEAHLRGDNQ